MKALYEYKILFFDSPIKIDADWDKAIWKECEEMHLTNCMGKIPGFFPDVRVKAMYDKGNIYVIFKVKDRFVRCLTDKINGKVWEDSCVEFFFSPDISYPERYFNLEVNCGGTPLMHYNLIAGEKITELKTSDIQGIEIASTLPEIIDPEIRDNVSWNIEYRIPFSLLERYSKISVPEPGVIWRGNFFKISENSSNPHYLTWSEVKHDFPNFHIPEYFGILHFK